MGTPVLRVLIIAGDPLARSGLAHILADQSGLSVVGQATVDADLSAETGATRPDALLWDTGWDQTPALAVPQELPAGVQDAGPPMVALLADARLARELWAAGVGGLLPRHVRRASAGRGPIRDGRGARSL